MHSLIHAGAVIPDAVVTAMDLQPGQVLTSAYGEADWTVQTTASKQFTYVRVCARAWTRTHTHLHAHARTHGHTHTRGVPGVMPVIGFPEEGLPDSSPPLVGFPDPIPHNPSFFRPSSALLIGIRSAGTPLTRAHTHARTCTCTHTHTQIYFEGSEEFGVRTPFAIEFDLKAGSSVVHGVDLLTPPNNVGLGAYYSGEYYGDDGDEEVVDERRMRMARAAL
jgi:hypothetical protein